MAREVQDVIIVGTEGSVTAWSTESTQQSIAAGIAKSTAQNTAIISLLRLVAKGEKATSAQLSAVKVEIAKVARSTQRGNKDEAKSNQSTKQAEGKNNSYWRAMLNLQKVNNGQNKRSERNAAARQTKISAMMKMGSSRSSAEKSVSGVDMIMETVKAVAKIVLVVKTLADIVKESVSAGFTERFDMASDMRQSGLMAGMEEAGQGFIKISNMISKTGFTFGEAAEFTKRFSKAVGVTGVKSALDFASGIADADNANGLMRKFNMDFPQIANMSGQYLESLRVAGQLQGRDKQELKAGMESFMSNVQMTSNVLKISMEEAAELMQKSVAPDQAGLLATLPKEMRMAAENALKAMNVQGGPMGEALAARLAAGSEQAFLQTEEYQNLAGTGVGQELLSFINQIAPSVTAGGSEEDFQKRMANEFPKFAESLQEFASQDGVRVQLLGNKQLAALVGQLLESAQTYGDADKGISGGGKEDRARMLANEQTRRATMLAEDAMTKLMPKFTENLIKLTATNEAFAQAANRAIIDYKTAIGGIVDGSVWAEEKITGAGTGALEVASWGASWFNDSPAVPLDGEDRNYNTIIPPKTALEQTKPHADRLATNTQTFADNSADMFGGSIKEATAFLEKVGKSKQTTTDAIIAGAGNGMSDAVLRTLSDTARDQQKLFNAVTQLVTTLDKK